MVKDRQEKEVGVQVLAVAEGMVHRLFMQIKFAGLELRPSNKQATRRTKRVRPTVPVL